MNNLKAITRGILDDKINTYILWGISILTGYIVGTTDNYLVFYIFSLFLIAILSNVIFEIIDRRALIKAKKAFDELERKGASNGLLTSDLER